MKTGISGPVSSSCFVLFFFFSFRVSDFHIHVVMRTKSDMSVSACYGNEGCFSLSLLVEETKTHSSYFPKLAERRFD